MPPTYASFAPTPFHVSPASHLLHTHLCVTCIIRFRYRNTRAANFWLIGPGGGASAKVPEGERHWPTLGAAGVSSPAPVPGASSYSTCGGLLDERPPLPSPSDPCGDPDADPDPDPGLDDAGSVSASLPSPQEPAFCMSIEKHANKRMSVLRSQWHSSAC